MNVKQIVLSSEPQNDAVTNIHDAAHQTSLRQVSFLLGLGVYATAMGSPVRLAGIPLQTIFQDELGLSVTEVSTFFFIAGLPNCLRWLTGLVSDRVHIFGSRRRSYLIASTLLAALLWALSTLVPQRGGALLATVLLINIALIFATTTLGGLLVEYGQALGGISRLSHVRQIAMNSASVTAPVLGGFIAGETLLRTGTLGAGLLVITAVTTALSLRTEFFFRPDKSDPDKHATPSAAQPLSTFLLPTLATSVLYYLAPDPGIILFRFQHEALQLSPREIGFLNALTATGGLLGVLAYTRMTRRISYRSLLFAAVPLKIIASLLYLAYQSKTSAFFLAAFIGFFEITSVAPMQDLAARAASPKSAAFSFALIIGMANLAFGLSKVIAAKLHDAFGLPLSTLLWVQAISTLAVFLVLPFLPKALTKNAE